MAAAVDAAHMTKTMLGWGQPAGAVHNRWLGELEWNIGVVSADPEAARG